MNKTKIQPVWTCKTFTKGGKEKLIIQINDQLANLIKRESSRLDESPNFVISKILFEHFERRKLK